MSDRPARRRAIASPGARLSPRGFTALAAAVFAGLLAAWWLATTLGTVTPLFLPSPGRVGARLAALAASGQLWGDMLVSIYRIVVGFLLATAMAVPLGVLIGRYRVWEALIEPVIDFIRYMPVVAFVPLTILWTGTGDAQKFLIIWIGTFFQQVLLIMDNAKRVPDEFVDVGRTLEMRPWRILTSIVVPCAMPGIWDSLRISLGWAWTWLVLAELVAATSGLGYRITTAQRFFQTDTIIGYILVLGILGLVTDQGMKALARRLFAYERAQGAVTARLEVRSLSKTFAQGRQCLHALERVDLAVAENEFVALVGASGCGKSTLLSIIAGLQEHDTGGAVLVDGRPIEGPGRDRGVVFQNYSLMPWLTARANVAFALRGTGTPAAEMREIAAEHLALVGLERFADAYPSQLSGGMRQRVAIARALCYRPKILLMDEPFGALDALTRQQMQELLTEVWDRHRLAVLFVTHDVDEAVFLADRVAVMASRPGRIKDMVPVGLPRPRRPEIAEGDAFIRLRHRVLTSIRAEMRHTAETVGA